MFESTMTAIADMIPGAVGRVMTGGYTAAMELKEKAEEAVIQYYLKQYLPLLIAFAMLIFFAGRASAKRG